MIREIKFRAWVNDHWVDWIPTCKTLGAYNASIIDTDGYTFEEDNPFIVEQYTGLKDKNGKEIYEGDIIRYDAIDYKVLWADYYAGFETKRLNSPWNNAGLTLHFLASVGRVIGNIHEKDKLVDFDHDKGGEE